MMRRSLVRGVWGRWVVCLAAAMTVAVWTGCGDDDSGSGRPMSFDEEAAAIQKDGNLTYRARELTKLAFRRYKAKDKSGAELTLFSAQEACKEIPDLSARADAFGLLAEAQSRMDDRLAAKKTLATAREAIDQITQPEVQALALATLAGAAASASQPELASEILKDAEKRAAELKDYEGKPGLYGQALVLARSAEAYQQLGRRDEAEHALTDAIKRAQQDQIDRERCTALLEISFSQGRMKQTDASAKTLGLALEEARKVEKLHSRAHILADLGDMLARAGQTDKAREILTEADRVAAKIPEQDLHQQAQEKVRRMLDKLPARG